MGKEGYMVVSFKIPLLALVRIPQMLFSACQKYLARKVSYYIISLFNLIEGMDIFILYR